MEIDPETKRRWLREGHTVVIPETYIKVICPHCKNTNFSLIGTIWLLKPVVPSWTTHGCTTVKCNNCKKEWNISGLYQIEEKVV